MTVFVSLLRGINVGGKNRVPMAELRKVYESIGFRSVATYIQSGNVIFETAGRGSTSMAAAMEKAIRERFQLDIRVVNRTRADLERAAARNPFIKEPGIDTRRLAVMFLSGAITAAAAKTLVTPAGIADRFVVREREIYLHCPDGFGVTKLTNDFFERRLGLASTARNWNTVLKLCALAAGLTGSS